MSRAKWKRGNKLVTMNGQANKILVKRLGRLYMQESAALTTDERTHANKMLIDAMNDSCAGSAHTHIKLLVGKLRGRTAT